MTDFLDSSSLNNAPPFPPQNAAALTLQAKHRASSRKDGPLFSAPQLGPSRLSITSLAGRGGSTYPESARMRGALARGPAHPHKPGLRRLRRFFLALLPFAFVLHFALGKSQALPFIQGLRKTGFWGEWKGEDLQEGGVPHLAAESLRDRKALESRERWREIQLQGGWEAAKALGLTARGGESSKEIIVHGLERKSEEGGSGKRVGLAQPEDLDDDEDDDEDVNARSAMATDSPPIMEQQVAGSAEIEVRLEKAEFPQLKREQNAESARGNQGEAAGEEVQAVAAKGTVEQGEGRREESLRWQHLPEEGQRQEIAEGIEKEQKGGGGQDGQRRQQWLQEGQDRSARDFVDSAAQKQVSEEGKGESRGLSEGWAVDGDGGGVSAQALAGALAGGLKLGYAEGAGKIVEAGGEGEWGEETELERRAQLAEGAKRAAYGEVKSADVEKSAKSSKPRRYLYFGETIDDGQTGGLIHQVNGLACALQEAHYLRRYFVMPTMFRLDDRHRWLPQGFPPEKSVNNWGASGPVDDAERWTPLETLFDFKAMRNSSRFVPNTDPRWLATREKAEAENKTVVIQGWADRDLLNRGANKSAPVLVHKASEFWFTNCLRYKPPRVAESKWEWDHIVFAAPLRGVAEHMISVMGGRGNYSTMHIRRGDKLTYISVKTKQQVWPNLDLETRPDFIAAKIAQWVPKNESLYIASNEAELGFFKPLSEKYGFKIWTYHDFLYALNLCVDNDYQLFAVEMEVVKHGRLKIATFKEDSPQYYLSSHARWPAGQ